MVAIQLDNLQPLCWGSFQHPAAVSHPGLQRGVFSTRTLTTFQSCKALKASDTVADAPQTGSVMNISCLFKSSLDFFHTCKTLSLRQLLHKVTVKKLCRSHENF